MRQEMIRQYLLALLFCCGILLFLYCSPAGKKSLLLPEDDIANHSWYRNDIMTYVNPARTFIKSGTFSRGGQPDMHRTIGYPFFLAIVMQIFGKYWLPATYLLQLPVFALLFPASSCIAGSLFPHMRGRERWSIVLLLLISGICLAYTGQLMTDQLFTSLLTVGIACGFAAVRNASWNMTILHILLVGYAAQVRPTLGLFFLADCCFLLYVARIWQLRLKWKRCFVIAVSVFILAVVGNGPAIRNYFNHGIFTPTDVLSDNLACYLAGPVMIKEGRDKEYEKMLDGFKQLEGRERIESKKNFAFKIYRQYPLTTGIRIIYHAFWNLLEPHWEYILNSYATGFSLNNFYDHEGNIKESIYFGLPFYFYYILLYSSFTITVIRISYKKHFLFIAGIIVYLLPFVFSFINGQGARMRLYIEPIILVISFDTFSHYRAFLKKRSR